MWYFCNISKPNTETDDCSTETKPKPGKLGTLCLQNNHKNVPYLDF